MADPSTQTEVAPDTASPSRSSSRVLKAELYVTTYCEGRCPFCFGQGDFCTSGTHVPIERLLHRADILRAFHRSNPLYAVPLLGGEPLTHPDLPILAKRFGEHLPFALVSAGLPDDGADLDALIEHIRMWGVTYNQHLTNRFVALAQRLLEGGRRVDASMHFRDFESFRAVNLDFIARALPCLPLTASWGSAFRRWVESWTPRTYYQASFKPFESAPMTVHYSILDERFMRGTPRHFEAPLHPKGRSFTCHLFTSRKTIAIAEDGRVFPCTSNAQRHAAPVIMDLDRFRRLPDDLAARLDRLAGRLFDAAGDHNCTVACKDLSWHLDR
jgi:MoaA/NifB/PqqE/SkfB family radical SAM enzyme